MTFDIQTIPFGLMRYPSAGDFWVEGEVVKIRIVKLYDWKYEALILVHELVEFFIVKHQGISISKIDRFDIHFEKNRVKGNTDEPGDDKKSPYKFAHGIATGVERILAVMLGVCWKSYEEKLESL